MASLTQMMTLLAYYFNSKVYIPWVLEASLATSDHVKLVTRQLQRFVKPDGHSHTVLLTFLKKERKLMPRWKNALIKRTKSASAIYCRKKKFLNIQPLSFIVWMKKICALKFNRKFADFEVYLLLLPFPVARLRATFFSG